MVVRIFGFRGTTCTGSEGFSMMFSADGAGRSGTSTENRFEVEIWGTYDESDAEGILAVFGFSFSE